MVLHASNTASFTTSLSNRCDNGHRTSQKLNAGQTNQPFFPCILRHHCILMYHRLSRMSQSRSSSPAGYGCAVSRHNLPMSSGRSNMLRPDNVFLAVKPGDMRRGIDTLTQYIQDGLKSTWHEGAAFVFTNKARSRIKVLRWDKHGVWLCTPLRTSTPDQDHLRRLSRLQSPRQDEMPGSTRWRCRLSMIPE